MGDRDLDDAALSDIRSSLAADVAGLAAPSFRHTRQGERTPGVPAQARPGSSGVHVTVNLASAGVVFLDDQRRMRLLAREIKRLIIEDVRRGIDV